MPPTLFSTCLFTLVLQQKEINYCGGSFAPFLLRFHGTSSQLHSCKTKLLFLNFQLTTSAQTPTTNEPNVFSSLNSGVSPGFFPDLHALILLHTKSKCSMILYMQRTQKFICQLQRVFLILYLSYTY